ncbi:MAG: hypothetical protein AAF704_13140, partial [Cyanobacteria bacterium P01_D01_bin.123]
MNERLRGSRVRVNQVKQSLYLRATLPPKSGEASSKQRRIPIAPATPEGLEWAEAQAFKLNSDLMRGTFVWQDLRKSHRNGRMLELGFEITGEHPVLE